MNEFLTSEGYEGLDPLQADLIFRTNIQTAYNVGHYEQMTDPGVMKLRPYWQYDAVNDAHTRPSHLAMDGRVFPADSAVWDSWFPPNGFRCRCTVKTLSKRQVEALLARRGWQMPVVLTHTCPLRYKPLEALKPDLDQSTVDCTTELWMDAIESRLRYDHWFCGHFHTDKQIDNLQILFQTFVPFPSEG